MEKLLREALGTSKLEAHGRSGGGCINSGSGFQTDAAQIFVKHNSKPEALDMFEGEAESLRAIVNTGAIQCPKPIKVIAGPGKGAMLVTDYVDISGLHRYQAELGEQLANMHDHNRRQMEKAKKTENTVTQAPVEYEAKFGFSRSTRCGILPQSNEWKDDWLTFFAEKLDTQMKWIQRDYGDRKAQELWSELQMKMSHFFPPELHIVPALVHGDLWSGNAGENNNGPVVFDPACFYGHSEYDFGIMQMFSGYPAKTHSAYHRVIAKQPGHEDRVLLYELFHHLNHWNHFGSGYRSGSISIMKRLVDKVPCA